jgi:disulfide bond formation protein DsbB
MRIPRSQASRLFRNLQYFGVLAAVIGLVVGLEQSGALRWVIWLVAFLLAVWCFTAGTLGLRRVQRLDTNSSVSRPEDDALSPDVRSLPRPTLIDELDKSHFVAGQAAKWGDKAAALMWKRQQDRRLLAVLVSLVFLVAVLSNIHKPLTWVLLFVGVSIGLLVAVRTVNYGQRMYRAASETLGVEVDWRRGHAPPRRSPAYEEWCTKNGLTPYAASERFGRGRQSSGSRPT